MKPITFLIRVDHRPDGRFDAFCENIPEAIVSGHSSEEAASGAIDAVGEHIANLVELDATPNKNEQEFLEEAFRVSQKHSGDPSEWLPMNFDAEGVHLGQPIGALEAVTIQFATSSGSISGGSSVPVVREPTAVAV